MIYHSAPLSPKPLSQVRSTIFDDGMAPDWRRYSFDWQAGRPAVLIIAPPDSFTEVAPTIASFDAASPMFEVRNADVLVLSTPDQADTMRALLASDSRVQLIDCNSDLIAESGATEGEIVVGVVDRNLRVALRCNPGSPDVYIAACLECLDRLVSAVPAPVLILPNVLPQVICRTLVDRLELSNSVEGKVAGVDPAGMPTCYVNRALKSRRDFQIRRDDPLDSRLRRLLLERCSPEIAKAFQTEIAYADRLMLARYDAPHGWFKRHRDNASGNVAFRQFAITVNLNTGDYEGGHLTFPEYNDQPYTAPTGAGIIFSASLLHEVSYVTRGSRYALLTFFHSEAAEVHRRQYEARIVARQKQNDPA
jgi:predicted 2-oxoglutarate/Fe(II)-dependent dioxygenase YbiX